MSDDGFADLKSRQREMWASFAPTATFTTPVAARLVRFAGAAPGEPVMVEPAAFDAGRTQGERRGRRGAESAARTAHSARVQRETDSEGNAHGQLKLARTG